MLQPGPRTIPADRERCGAEASQGSVQAASRRNLSGTTVASVAGSVGRVGAISARALRAGLGEMQIYPRHVIGGVISKALPRFGFNRTRTALLRMLGVSIGARSLFFGGLDITGPGRATDLLSIGDDSTISGPLFVDLGAPVRIGNGVQIGHHVTLLTLDHQIGPSQHRCGTMMAGPIEIGDGAWIGSHVTILPGVRIGKGAVIATGAIVAHDVPADVMAGGVPARVLRQLDEPAPVVSCRRRVLAT